MQARTTVDGLGGNRGLGMAVAAATLAASASLHACDRPYLPQNDGESSASCADSWSGH